MEIADYDKFGYDYEQYWRDQLVKRQYEDSSERMAIGLMLKHIPKHGVICDLGCGFGRLYDAYADHFDTAVLTDFSFDNLRRAREIIMAKNEGKLPSVYFVAANAYALPFRDEVFDALITVRLFHHMEKVTRAIGQISRVIKPLGQTIIEYANKKHFAARIRHLKHRKDSNFHSLEPEKKGEAFYNFNPQQIEKDLHNAQLPIAEVLSVSNLRSQFLKKWIPVKGMVAFEKILQSMLAASRFGPSIFVRSEKNAGDTELIADRTRVDIKDILLCPSCGSESLAFFPSEIVCQGCSRKFSVIDGIIDMRVE